MKIKLLAPALFIALSISACSLFPRIIRSSSESGTSATSQSVTPATSSGKTTSTNTSSGPTKVKVAAHTLKDSNPPIDIDSKGQIVSEATWNSFRNASDSKFDNNYNFTYTAYAGGNLTTQCFTKNGYYVNSIGGRLYYERKSGSTFYHYVSTSEGYLRQEETLDIKSKYIGVIQHEIYVHMFDFSNYEYNDYDGCYRYNTAAFSTAVKFQGGYLTYIFYLLFEGMNRFQIDLSYQTTIDIPESYYYQ